jgi:polysaccharide pyruvyl transferase WcaK-like protein
VRAVLDGYEVTMFGTDRPDMASVAECHEMAARQLAGDARARLRAARIDATGPLISLLASCDAVVAARLHGVLLAHVVGCPVLAIAHERKVATLMSELGHDSYCIPIDATEPPAASAALADLLAHGDALRAQLRANAMERRSRVNAQYDALFRSRT